MIDSFVMRDSTSPGCPKGRFGHSTTRINSNEIFIFGGAICDGDGYSITNDCYRYVLSSEDWISVGPDTSTPSARAAHGACYNDDENSMIIYGGATGSGTMSCDSVYVLNMAKSGANRWKKLSIPGKGPGRRYGHTMVYSRSYLILFGGNDGATAMGDLWVLNMDRFYNKCDTGAEPTYWNEISVNPAPFARLYHTLTMCIHGPASGMAVLFGGRDKVGKSLNDMWGLRRHRNGSWEWILAPQRSDSSLQHRYQHACCFFGAKMIVTGGRSDIYPYQPLDTFFYDTETTNTHILPHISKFRHSSWLSKGYLYLFGGFDHSMQRTPLEGLFSVPLSDIVSTMETDNSKLRECASQSNEESDVEILPKRDVPCVSRVSDATDNGRSTCCAKFSPNATTNISVSDGNLDAPNSNQQSEQILKIPIGNLQEESKKLKDQSANVYSMSLENKLVDHVLSMFLNPKISHADITRCFNTNDAFKLSHSDVFALCDQTIDLIKSEPNVLKLRSPIKVFGDIHGQYFDLMRFFNLYKSPVEDFLSEKLEIQGDLDSTDYLFLGDYVDRGSNSLEVIVLLITLKLKYPERIHLIRGNHEDAAINCVYGFMDECIRRLNDNVNNPSKSCWHKFNALFEYMPLAAVIEDNILCLHGGIGGSVNFISDISRMNRPLSVSQIPSNYQEQQLTDILWSDPTENDQIYGVHPNDVRDPECTGYIVKYGPDRVHSFLLNNNLSMIIRAHECVKDGFERFADGKLVTLFSATNYCNHNNAGALLFIRRDLLVIPKLMYPYSNSQQNILYNHWDPKITQLRPPTPPRGYDNSV